jgi:hypothetical protein
VYPVGFSDGQRTGGCLWWYGSQIGTKCPILNAKQDQVYPNSFSIEATGVGHPGRRRRDESVSSGCGQGVMVESWG